MGHARQWIGNDLPQAGKFLPPLPLPDRKGGVFRQCQLPQRAETGIGMAFAYSPTRTWAWFDRTSSNGKNGPVRDRFRE
jgi:hypothetical protein